MWSLIRIGPEPAKTKIWLAKETDSLIKEIFNLCPFLAR